MKVPVLRRSSRSLLGKRSAQKTQVTTPTIVSTESGSTTGLEVSFDDWKVTQLSFEQEQPVAKKPKRTKSVRDLFKSMSLKNANKQNKKDAITTPMDGDSQTLHTTTRESPSPFEDFPPNDMEWTKVSSPQQQQQQQREDVVESRAAQQPQHHDSSDVWDPFGLGDANVWEQDTNRNSPNSTLWVPTYEGTQSKVDPSFGDHYQQESFSDDESSACTTNGVIMEHMDGGQDDDSHASLSDNGSSANETISTKRTNVTTSILASDEDTASMFSLGVDEPSIKADPGSIKSARKKLDGSTSVRKRRQATGSRRRRPAQGRQWRMLIEREQNMFVEVFQDLRLLAEHVAKEEGTYKQCLCANEKQCL